MANVRWENHKALVCLVGEQIRRRPEIASQAFRAIGDIDVRMICQGASERSLSFLVDESRALEAVKRLHRSFFPALDAGPRSQLFTSHVPVRKRLGIDVGASVPLVRGRKGPEVEQSPRDGGRQTPLLIVLITLLIALPDTGFAALPPERDARAYICS